MIPPLSRIRESAKADGAADLHAEAAARRRPHAGPDADAQAQDRRGHRRRQPEARARVGAKGGERGPGRPQGRRTRSPLQPGKFIRSLQLTYLAHLMKFAYSLPPLPRIVAPPSLPPPLHRTCGTRPAVTSP